MIDIVAPFGPQWSGCLSFYTSSTTRGLAELRPAVHGKGGRRPSLRLGLAPFFFVYLRVRLEELVCTSILQHTQALTRPHHVGRSTHSHSPYLTCSYDLHCQTNSSYAVMLKTPVSNIYRINYISLLHRGERERWCSGLISPPSETSTSQGKFFRTSWYLPIR